MMRREQLENLRNSTEYLERLEKWHLLRWKRRLELLQETTEDLWLLRKILKMRRNAEYGIIGSITADSCRIIKFPKDEDNE